MLIGIGVGAGLACPVLAGPLFRQFNEIHYRYLHARAYYSRTTSKVLPTPLIGFMVHKQRTRQVWLL